MLNKNRYDAKKYLSNLLILGLTILALQTAACESPSLKKTNRALSTSENKQTEFESDLQTMKTANFEFIFVFRRKDSGKLDGEDKTFLKTNLPRDTNRVITSDDDKAVIAGSHFKFPTENLQILRIRFNVEDYPEPKG